MSRYWQHTDPIRCPQNTPMGWLGGPYWICGRECCNRIYVQHAPMEPGERGELIEDERT